MLSRTVALPVIVGAATLKGERLRRRGVPPSVRSALAAGVAASIVSTLASQALLKLVERDRALWPYAAYRAGLAAAVLAKLARERRTSTGSSLALPPGLPGEGRNGSGNRGPLRPRDVIR
jgi:hypothetical protein